jgi:hypothetical protein
MECFPNGPRATPTHHYSSAQRRDCANRIKKQIKAIDADQAAVSAFAASANGFLSRCGETITLLRGEN